MMFACPVCGEPYPGIWTCVRHMVVCRNCCLYGMAAEPVDMNREDEGLSAAVLATWEGKCNYVVIYRLGFYETVGADLREAFPDGIATLDAEAKRLHAEWDEHECIRPDGWPIDNTAWRVYADWLDEHDFPLNAKGIRCRHGSDADRAIVGVPLPGQARGEDVLRQGNPVPLRRLRSLEPFWDAPDLGSLRFGGDPTG